MSDPSPPRVEEGRGNNGEPALWLILAAGVILWLVGFGVALAHFFRMFPS